MKAYLIRQKKIIMALAFICVAVSTCLADNALAADAFEYKLLEQFPGFFNSGDSPSFPDMVSALYSFGIWTVGIAAFFMLIIGGFMYITSAGNTSSVGTAKKIIWDALLGLVAALVAYLILYVINPDLVNLNLNLIKVGINSQGVSYEGGNGEKIADYKGSGSCQNLATQSGIEKQCSDASPELTALLTCIKQKQPDAVISSISDSQGYTRCINNYGRPPCAHAQYSCHYGGKNCRGKGSFGVDFSTKNLSASKLKAAGKACGADFALDEGNHVHMSVGNKANCGCN